MNKLIAISLRSALFLGFILGCGNTPSSTASLSQGEDPLLTAASVEMPQLRGANVKDGKLTFGIRTYNTSLTKDDINVSKGTLGFNPQQPNPTAEGVFLFVGFSIKEEAKKPQAANPEITVYITFDLKEDLEIDGPFMIENPISGAVLNP